MASFHVPLWGIGTGAVGYAGMYLVAARHSFQKFRKDWMDKTIRSQKALEARLKPGDTRISATPEELLHKVRDKWESQGAKQASEGAFYAGVLWWVYWPIHLTVRKPELSELEARLMDKMAYERLQELERQARIPLEPLDDLEG